MRRATRFAIVPLLLYAVAIPAHATIMTLADANDSGTSNFDPALNGQPFAGCFFFENFDLVTPPPLPPGWMAINAIDPDGIFWQTSDSGDPIPPANSPPNAAWVNGFDGGVLEISVDGGPFQNILADVNHGDTISFVVTGTIGLTSGELLVDKSVTIPPLPDW